MFTIHFATGTGKNISKTWNLELAGVTCFTFPRQLSPQPSPTEQWQTPWQWRPRRVAGWKWPGQRNNKTLGLSFPIFKWGKSSTHLLWPKLMFKHPSIWKKHFYRFSKTNQLDPSCSSQSWWRPLHCVVVVEAGRWTPGEVYCVNTGLSTSDANKAKTDTRPNMF